MAEPGAERRVAAVTGGMGGIGGGIVVALTMCAFDVVVCDRTIDQAIAADLVSRAAPGARLSFASGDLADLGDHPRFVDAIFDASGRIDCPVNKRRGIREVARGSSRCFRRKLQPELRRQHARSVLSHPGRRPANAGDRGRLSRKRAFGRVHLILERRHRRSRTPRVWMSKAAITMMAKLYAVRLAPHGITLYEVRPRLIRTPMTGVAQARFDKLLEDGFIPINRWGTPEDVSRTVATMAAGDLPFTTGAAIQVDGGMHIHQY
jgi:3-oxoacyl-[acyl-carrier protein] reductase